MGKVTIKAAAMFVAVCVVMFVLWWIEWPWGNLFKTLEHYGIWAMIGGLGVLSMIMFFLVMEIHNMINGQGRWK